MYAFVDVCWGYAADFGAMSLICGLCQLCLGYETDSVAMSMNVRLSF
jgi:hypothetical protein